jgi:hypothetical protein
VAIATLGAVPGAHAILVFHAEGGGFSGPTEIHPTKEDVVPPQSVDDGEFSYGGALCPAPNAPDYMCMRFAATADIVLDSRLALHALAHVARHDAAAFPQNAQAYATAQVNILGMTGSLDTPAPSVYIYIGLAGTYATSSSSPDVVTQAFATVRLNGAVIQCDGTSSCPPVKVPFNSGNLSLSLRVDAKAGAPTMVSGYDGSAATDFFDTLEILAIQPLDEHDQPIPGEYYTIPDVNGGPLVVDGTPPPTTTTLPGATTTTTIPAGASTTTTVLPGAGTTTTTTLAPGCAAEVTTASVLCRIDALSMDAAAVAGPLATKLEARLQKVRAAIVAADAGPAAKTKRVLRKAVKRIRAAEPLLRSKKARHVLDDAVRTRLLTLLSGIESGARTLLAAASA